MKIAGTHKDDLIRKLTDDGHFTEAAALAKSAYSGKIPEKFETLIIFLNAVIAFENAGTIPTETLETLFSKAMREFVFEVGGDWERLSLEILSVTHKGIRSDLRNETRLTNGQRPDFIHGQITETEKGISFGETFIDAKKSCLAITTDIEDYSPFCKEIIFYVLEDKIQYTAKADGKVSFVYAKDLIGTAIPMEIQTKISQLLEKCETAATHVQNRLKTLCHSVETSSKASAA